MSNDWIYDYDDKEYLYQMDDDYAIGTDGHIVRNAGDNYGFDVGDGEIHLTSGWSSSDGDDDDDDGDPWHSDRDDWSGSGSSNINSSYQPASTRKKTDAEEHPGCAAIFWGFIAAIAVTYVLGVEGNHPIAYVVWILVAIVAAVLISNNKRGSASASNSSKSGSTYSYGIGSDDDDTYYRFCQVLVEQDGRKYYYRCPDSSIQKGDYVIVPEPDGAAGVPAEVLEARFYSRREVPVPLETAKYVKKKIDTETYFALVDKRKNKAEEEAARTPTEGETRIAPESREKANPSESKDHKWLNVILWIAAGVLICVVVGAMVMAFVKPQEVTGKAVPELAAVTETPEPTATPKPTPVVTRLSDQETEDKIGEILFALEDVTAYVTEYDEQFWSQESVEISYEMVELQEETWAGYRDDMYDLIAGMDDVQPSIKYDSSWEALKETLLDIAQMADILSDWDLNDDGEYKGFEAKSVNDDAFDVAMLVQMDLNTLDLVYTAANATPRPTATPKRTTPTPRPTATPKRSTSKSNSDPYNAGDYNNPEFFYDDWYDDFYDYDEAEDYWEEYGDW